MEDLTQFARRKTVKREGGVTLSYSIPAGVTDEQAAAEVARCERAVARGYTYRYRDHGFSVSIRWMKNQHPFVQWLVLGAQVLSRAPRYLDKALFWLKCRWLDAYWFVRDTWKSLRPTT